MDQTLPNRHSKNILCYFGQSPDPPTPDDRNSPPVHFYMLSIKEEDSGWDDGDVKVLCVHRHLVYIHNIHSSHFGDKNLILCKLRQFTARKVTRLAGRHQATLNTTQPGMKTHHTIDTQSHPHSPHLPPAHVNTHNTRPTTHHAVCVDTLECRAHTELTMSSSCIVTDSVSFPNRSTSTLSSVDLMALSTSFFERREGKTYPLISSRSGHVVSRACFQRKRTLFFSGKKK